MKTIFVISCMLVVLILVGCNAQTTGMVVGKANNPRYLTKAELIEGYQMRPTISYVRWPGAIGAVKFSDLEYPESLGYIENIDEPKIRYVGKRGKYKHLTGKDLKNIEWRNIDELTIKPGPVYKIYVARGGQFLKYIPEEE